MSQNRVKVALSFPSSLFHKVENLRRKEGRSRSAIVTEALSAWIERRKIKEEVKRYEKAYLDCPEPLEEVKAFESAATMILSQEEWK